MMGCMVKWAGFIFIKCLHVNYQDIIMGKLGGKKNG